MALILVQLLAGALLWLLVTGGVIAAFDALVYSIRAARS